MSFKLEVCVDSIASAINAQKGGANRVELCDNLVEGGTTPSAGVIKRVRELISIDVTIMIRPRGGDFLYSSDEIEAMKHDIKVVGELGADGVVFGCLTPDGKVDKELNSKLLEAAQGMEVTFHRAFDMTCDPFESLKELKELGINRVLTSGQKASAIEGADLIAQLVEQAQGQIGILAGGGIRPHNIQKLIKKTGVEECHVSGRMQLESEMKFRNPEVTMGKSYEPSEYTTAIVDPNLIKAFR